jgi:hypothetical protein
MVIFGKLYDGGEGIYLPPGPRRDNIMDRLGRATIFWNARFRILCKKRKGIVPAWSNSSACDRKVVVVMGESHSNKRFETSNFTRLNAN